MSNEQKLREAFSRIRARLMLDVIDSHTISLVIADCDQALATTEQEPTGMPELPEPDLLIDADLDSDAPYRACSVDLMRTYGEQCWKAGYKHGAWGTDTKDAERYRCIRRGQRVSVINGIGDILRAENLDAAIDAAMAKGVK